MTSNVWQGWQDFAPMVAEELLTWSLQVAGLLGAVWVVTALLLRKQTGLRSALWLTTLLLIPLLPLVARVSPVPTASLAQTLDLLRKSTPAEDLPWAMPEPTVARVESTPSSPEPTAAVPPTTVTSAVQPEPTPTELAALEGPPTFWSDAHFWAAAAVLAWGLGVLVMLARLVLGARWVRRLLRRAQPVSDPSLLKAFEETQRQIAVARPVQLRTSALVSVPMTVGVFHPVIILPRSALDASRRQPLEHALCHELAHVKRWDAATTLYRRVLEAVLFFHPLVWLASRRYQLEQEHICDDWAVAALGSRRQYARSLAELAEQAAHAAPVAALSFAHRPSAIRRRVTRVLEGKEMPKPRLGLRGLTVVTMLSLALLLLFSSLTVRSQAVEAAPPDEPALAAATPEAQVAHESPAGTPETGASERASVERAEEIFGAMRPIKGPADRYDRFVPELVALGSDIVPLLFEVLRSREGYHQQRVAIKVLAQLKDERIIPVLKQRAAEPQHKNELQQILLALLTQEPTAEMADYAASMVADQENSFDQEYIISRLSSSEIPIDLKHRLYSHYDDFEGYGKHAVIRGLGRIDDRAAYEQLARILRKAAETPQYRNEVLTLAVYSLGQLKNSDPCPLLLEVLKETRSPDATSFIAVLGERRYEPVIPLLEARMGEARGDRDGRDVRISAAGALCRFGRDYDKNAAIVRQALRGGYAPYRVVGWLKDKETTRLVGSQVSAKETTQRMKRRAILVLGRIGTDLALAELRDALNTVPIFEPDSGGIVRVMQFRDVGEAITAIGEQRQDQALVREGQDIQNVADVLPRVAFVGSRAEPLGRPDALPKLDPESQRAATWLNDRPDFIPKILEQLRDHPGTYYGRLLALLDVAWDDRAIPHLMYILEKHAGLAERNEDNLRTHHERVRDLVRTFLARKQAGNPAPPLPRNPQPGQAVLKVGTPAVSAYEEALRKKVSVNVDRSFDRNRLTVQYAVIAICNAAGIPYQWDKSRRLTQGQCARYIGPVRLRNVEAQKAIADILSPVGLAFSLDSNGLYLHKPTSTGEPPLGTEADEYEEALRKKVSVNVERSPDGNRLTVQYAVIAVCKAAGVPYQWDKSRRLTDAQAARYIGPVRLRNVEAQKAIADIVSPVGLTFSVDEKGVYLHTALGEMVLKHDDGTMEGKRSLAGSGHFVQFECPPGKWYLTEVHIFGSRYGTPTPPPDNWRITFCDHEFRTAKFVRKPYSLFQRGDEQWYQIPVPPLELPPSDVTAGGGRLVVPFWINVAFNPSQTKGVYVGYDSSDQECFSKAGLPDQKPTEIPEKYDWMIRLVITQDPPKEVPPNLGAWLEPRKPLPPWQEEGLVELKNDDGESDGKLSMGGRGPAIRFDNVPEGATLTRLRMYASRYGSGFDPETTFADYYLFDTEGRILQTGRIPYALFAYQEKWVDIPLKPVKVPGTFWVLINPEADRFKGIYTHYDTDVEATHSKSGRVPEELSDLKTKCDWMIRAYVRSETRSSSTGSGAGAGGELTERRYDLSGTRFATPPQPRRDDERLADEAETRTPGQPSPGIANLLVDEAETGIVHLIEMVTGEKVWEAGHVSREGSTLTVTNTAKVHGQVEEVLETLRAHPRVAVRTDLRFIAADPAWRDKFLSVAQETRRPSAFASTKTPTAGITSPDKERALLEFVEATDSMTLSAPRFTVFNGQLAYLAIGETKVLALEGRAAPPQPVWSGKVVEVHPLVQKDLKSIWLWLNVANSQVQEVERTRADGTVEKVPKVATSQLVTTLAGPDGSTFLISLGPMAQEAEQGGDGREPRELLVVVKTKVLLEDEPEVNLPELRKP